MLNAKSGVLKRVTSFFLALILLLSSAPIHVFAQIGEDEVVNPEEVTIMNEGQSDGEQPEEAETPVKNYTITFEANGGTGKMEEVEVAEGTVYKLPESKFKAPEKQEFNVWGLEVEDPEADEPVIEEYKVDDEIIVDKDLTFKAIWKDKKVGPVKELINNLLGKEDEAVAPEEEVAPETEVATEEPAIAEEETTEDKDILEISPEIEEPAVTAGPAGDPEGTVVSKDGKTRITDFHVNWVGTDEDTVIEKTKLNWAEARLISENKQVQLSWAISGERTYAPGMLKYTIPYKLNLEGPQKGDSEVFYYISSFPVPEAKLLKDGSIDFSADYGKANFVYTIKDNEAFIINVAELAPGNSGTQTVSYKLKIHPFKIGFDRDSDHISKIIDDQRLKIRPYIEVFLPEEVLRKEDKTLYLGIDTASSVSIEKYAYSKFKPQFSNVTENWDKLSEIIYKYSSSSIRYIWPESFKPENYEDYYYGVYGFTPKVIFNQSYNLEIKENIGPNQEIIGYYIDGKHIKHEPDEKGIAFTLTNRESSKIQGEKNTFNYERRHEYPIPILVKIPKETIGDAKRKEFTNEIEAKLKPLNSNDEPTTVKKNAKLVYIPTPPKAQFTAPIGNIFKLKKYIDSKYSSYLKDYIYYQEESKTLISPEYKKEDGIDVFWRIRGEAEMLKYGFNPESGDEDDLSSYTGNPYKLVLADDYLYLGNDYKRELTGEDYEVTSVYPTIIIREYGYDEETNEYKYLWKDKAKNPIKDIELYGRKSSTGEWERLAIFDEVGSIKPANFRPQKEGVKLIGSSSNYIGIPSGYSNVKMEISSSEHGISAYMYIKGKLKTTSPYVQQCIEETKTDTLQVNLKLRNDATIVAYDKGNNILGIKSTSKRDENNSRSLDLDLKQYGHEMYHDTAYWNLKVEAPKELKNSVLINKEILGATNHRDKKEIAITAEVRFIQVLENVNESGINSRKELESIQWNYEKGTFYDLLPRGVNSISYISLYSLGSNSVVYIDKDTESKNIKYSYELIHNWKNSGRTLLKVDYWNAKLSTEKESDKIKNRESTTLKLRYHMDYSWNAYKDFGPNLKNYVIMDTYIEADDPYVVRRSGSTETSLYNTFTNDVKSYNEWLSKEYLTSKYAFGKDVVEIMSEIEPTHTKRTYLYSKADKKVTADTQADTGLTKFVSSKYDSQKLKTKADEGGSYSYNLRMQSSKGTDTKNLIIYDSIENYNPIPADEDYGAKQWRGTLESIDTSYAVIKGANPIVYISTIDKLFIPENRDLTDTNVWKKYAEGDDLSKVTAVAIDLRTKPDGSPFVLEEDESVNINLNMRAPWGKEAKEIVEEKAKALNEVYANATVTNIFNQSSENKLINTAYTAVDVEPVTTEATIEANKTYVDREGQPIKLKGGDFTFQLKEGETVLQEVKNDAEGKITFEPIKYNSWDVGEHTYTIAEVKGDNNEIAYDDHVETIKVNVERTGTSEITATVIYDEDGANFKNEEKGTAQVQLIKYGEDKDTPLSGAEFELYFKNGEPVLGENEEQIVLITAEEGKSQIVELEAGDYYLIESKAPNGYTLSGERHEFTIGDKDLGTLVTLEYMNDQLKVLPSTGGQGTRNLMIGGSIFLAIMGAVLFIANKKKKEQADKA